MIRGGIVCGKCKGGKCRDKPNMLEPLEVECPRCGGAGCDACGDGWFKITECPNRWLGRETVQLVGYFDRFRKGLGIASSCQLDETQWTLSAEAFFRAEEGRYRPNLTLDGQEL